MGVRIISLRGQLKYIEEEKPLNKTAILMYTTPILVLDQRTTNKSILSQLRK